MKRFLLCGAALLGALCCTGCAAGSSAELSEPADPAADGLTVTVPEDMDPAYGETLKQYFEAIEAQDYDAYLATVYPPYSEAYSIFLAAKDSDLQTEFEKTCHRFDEDGYESWTLTSLELSYYSVSTETYTSNGVSDYFQLYVDSGIFDDAFVEKCMNDAEDIRDIKFTLYALYNGDTEAVPVVTGGEIMMLITADGCTLFG